MKGERKIHRQRILILSAKMSLKYWPTTSPARPGNITGVKDWTAPAIPCRKSFWPSRPPKARPWVNRNSTQWLQSTTRSEPHGCMPKHPRRDIANTLLTEQNAEFLSRPLKKIAIVTDGQIKPCRHSSIWRDDIKNMWKYNNAFY